MSDRLAKAARKAAGSRHLPAARRQLLAEEMTGHLRDAARAWQERGATRRQAERRALRDFGETRRARTQIGRAWRGRRILLFPRNPADYLRSIWVHDGRLILLVLALVVLVRWQVVAAYHIPTKSMEPTLHGDPAHGDKILVNKLYFHLFPPERWQIAVFDRAEDDRNLIKRIVGLSGEEIDVRDGDVYIDGEIARKPRRVQESMLVPVFARGRDLLAGLHGERRTGLDAWRATGRWSAAGEAFEASCDDTGRASLAWPEPVRDEYPGGSERLEPDVVGDLALEFGVRAGPGAGTVGAVLRERGDDFELRLPVGAGDAVLLRNKAEVARADGASLRPERLHRVRFANLDDRVTAELDGREILAFDVEDPSREDDSERPPAELGILGGTASFAAVELRRDIHYHDAGKLPVWIPEGHCFMLGDNSGNSTDSRSWGPVAVDRLIGRPIMVFWPPSRLQLVK